MLIEAGEEILSNPTMQIILWFICPSCVCTFNGQEKLPRGLWRVDRFSGTLGDRGRNKCCIWHWFVTAKMGEETPVGDIREQLHFQQFIRSVHETNSLMLDREWTISLSLSLTSYFFVWIVFIATSIVCFWDTEANPSIMKLTASPSEATWRQWRVFSGISSVFVLSAVL